VKRVLTLLNTIVTYFALTFLLVAGVAGSLTGKPLLLTAVRSGSMYPTLTRGDLVFLRPVGENTPLQVGDVLVFKLEAGSLRNAGWVIHRAVDGDPEQGFITQGDNNDEPDQARDANPPVTRESIAAKAITIGDKPLHIPLLGYLPLWAEKAVEQPYVLPGAALLILILAFAGHMAGQKGGARRRRGRRRGGSEPLLYLVGSLSLFVLLAAAGLMMSQQYAFQYSVSQEGRAAVMGSNIGQLLVGDEVTRKLGTVENKRGRLPLVLAVSKNDDQVSLNVERATLAPGDQVEMNMTIKAAREGQYKTHIWVGLFYPILPPGIIQTLAAVSFWLALAVVSFIPALPVLLIPIVDESLRVQLGRLAQRSLRRFRVG